MTNPVCLQNWFSPLSLLAFMQDYYCRRPIALTGVIGPFAEVGSMSFWSTAMGAPDTEVLAVKQGGAWQGPVPTTVDGLFELYQAGYTLVCRHAERHDAYLAEVVDEFARVFAAPIDVHLFCTPPDSAGFSWHYDVEEVFVVQIGGTKRFELRKNTVNPWPMLDGLPQDMQYERECMPLSRCELSAGDLLYIPSGYWHRASSTSASVSLSIGVMAPTALSLLDHLRHSLLDDMRWRQRLPALGAWRADDRALHDTLRQLLTDLSADLARKWDGHFLESFIAHARSSTMGICSRIPPPAN